VLRSRLFSVAVWPKRNERVCALFGEEVRTLSKRDPKVRSDLVQYGPLMVGLELAAF